LSMMSAPFSLSSDAHSAAPDPRIQSLIPNTGTILPLDTECEIMYTICYEPTALPRFLGLCQFVVIQSRLRPRRPRQLNCHLSNHAFGHPPCWTLQLCVSFVSAFGSEPVVGDGTPVPDHSEEVPRKFLHFKMHETFKPRFPAAWREAMRAKPAPFALFSAPIFADLFHQPARKCTKTTPKQPCLRTNQPSKVLAAAISPAREHKHRPPRPRPAALVPAFQPRRHRRPALPSPRLGVSAVQNVLDSTAPNGK
jgi:hypothetical protein